MNFFCFIFELLYGYFTLDFLIILNLWLCLCFMEIDILAAARGQDERFHPGFLV